MSRFKFLVEGIKHFREIGTITPSGKALSIKLASFIPEDRDVTVLEIGAGDGPITQAILDRISSNSRLISIELNAQLHSKLATIEDDRFEAVLDSAENIFEILSHRNIEKVDYIASAIPFIVFSEDKARDILNICKDVIRPEGRFLQIHYAKSLKPLYNSVFGNVKTHFVLRNLPPAYVFVCEVI